MGDRFAHAQTRGVDGRQQEPMARMRGHREQPPDFLAAQDLGQFLRLLREGDVEVGPRMAQRHMVEKAEGVGRLTTRAPRQLSFLDQVGEIGLHLVAGDLVRRSPVVLRQSHDGGDVRLVSAGGEAAHGHVADHAVSERAHGTPPWRDELQGGDGASTERRSTVACVERAAADQQNDGRVIRVDVRATASAV